MKSLITVLILYAVFLLMPGVGILMLLPAPFVFLGVATQRYRRSIAPVVLITLGAGAVISPVNALIFLSYAVAMPLILLIMNRRGQGSSWLSILCASLPASALYAAMFFSSDIAGMQTDIIEAFRQYYESIPLTDAQRLQYDYQAYDIWEERVALLVKLSPALILMILLSVSYFTEKIYFRPPYDKILDIPDFLLVFPVCGGILFLLQQKIPGAAILLVCATLYFCRGFDIVWYYIVRWKFFIFFKIAVILSIIIYPPVQAAVVVLGLVSVFVKLIRKEADDSPK